MKARITRVLGVPLRKGKFRGQVRVGHLAHAYGTSWNKAHTRCGIHYTMQKGKALPQATRTARDVDCMACIAGSTELSWIDLNDIRLVEEP